MEKYKICPACGKHNMSTMLECLFCETDLTGVRILDKEAEEKMKQLPPEDPKEETAEMVRICEECGAVNRVADRKCTNCGEDISDIVPTPRTEEEPQVTNFVLSSLDGEYAFQITESETIVGREAAMKEYLGDKMFVSRQHARINLAEDRLTITNISATNYTFVNNKRVIEEKHPIQDGDEIGLGGCIINGERQERAAYFVVRIGACM